jgi:Ca-activated chloride channel family protein
MRATSSLFLILISAGALAVHAQETQEPTRINVDVSLVTLDVQVSDVAGRPVTTMKREDFEIYENGQLQEIASFISVDSPYTVLVLFDCSGSTRPNWPFLVQSMNRFTAKLRPQDRIAVSQFGSSYKKLLEWTSANSGPVDVEVQTNDSSCSSTDFYGALNRALSDVRASTGRKGVVVLTDGGHSRIPYQRLRPDDTRPSRYVDAEDDGDFQKVLRAVKGSDVVLYFVAVSTDLNPDPGGVVRGFDPTDIYNLQQVRARMELLAEESGGRLAFPRDPQDVIPLFEQIGQELGTSYGLGYLPVNSKKDGTYRKIEVRVRDKSLQVRQSRSGYEAPLIQEKE